MNGAVSSASRGNDRGIWVGLFVLTVVAFLPALGNDFVQWDDDISLYQNPHVQGLGAHRLWWMFTNVAYALRYKPLTWLAYALIHAVVGLQPFAYHAVALAFHAANVVLLYLVVRRLLEIVFPPRTREENHRIELFAALGALIWGVNPLRVEPVARVTDLTYCQSLFFVLISLLCYLRACEEEFSSPQRRRWYWRAVGAFALAMFTYPFVSGYALVLVVMDYFVLKRFHAGKDWWRDAQARRLWLEKAPFVLLAAGIAVVTYWASRHPTGIWAGYGYDPLSIQSRLMQAFYILAYYVWKPWAPLDLSPYYNTLVFFNAHSWLFTLSAFGVVIVTALLIRNRREHPLLLALWLCHCVLLGPALGLTVFPHYASDRYCYVEGVLWSVLIAGGCVKWCNPKNTAWVAGALAALALVFGTMSWRQTHIWHDTLTLYRYMLVKLGDDPYAAQLHQRLGIYLVLQGNAGEAIPELEAALQKQPNSAMALTFLGRALMAKGRIDEATDRFREAVKSQPENSLAHDGYGVALCAKDRYAEAVPEFQLAIKLDPGNTDARNHLSATQAKLK